MRAFLLISLGCLAACGDPPDPLRDTLLAASAVAEDAAAPWPPWSVRGRWEGAPPQLAVGVDDSGGPLGEGVFRRAVAEAVEAWSRSGLVDLELLESNSPRGSGDAGRPPGDLLVRWGLAPPGQPSPFANRPGFAFTGEVGPGAPQTLVQLDPVQPWRTGPQGGGPGLVGVLAHELGHALGLGHTERTEALLSPRGDLVADGPRAADLAGLASLYGPVDGPEVPGDLLILASGSSTAVAPALRGLATCGRSAFGLGDMDGDGDDEVLVWRTDREGYGSLVALDFGPGPRLRKSLGPWVGLVLPGAPAGPVRAADGSLIFLVVRPDDGWLAYTLSGRLGLRPFGGSILELQDLPGDADGDGFLDLGSPAARELFERGLQRRSGDLDGDGRLEELRPIR